jgi:hypothetical protein
MAKTKKRPEERLFTGLPEQRESNEIHTRLIKAFEKRQPNGNQKTKNPQKRQRG